MTRQTGRRARAARTVLAMACAILPSQDVRARPARLDWAAVTAKAIKEKAAVDWLEEVLGDCAMPPHPAPGERPAGWSTEQVKQCRAAQNQMRAQLGTTQLIVDTRVKLLAVKRFTARFFIFGWTCVEITRLRCPTTDLRCGHRHLSIRLPRDWDADEVCRFRPRKDIVAATVNIGIDEPTARALRKTLESGDGSAGAIGMVGQLLVSPTALFHTQGAPIRTKVHDRWWVTRPDIQGLDLQVHAWRLRLGDRDYVGRGAGGWFPLQTP